MNHACRQGAEPISLLPMRRPHTFRCAVPRWQNTSCDAPIKPLHTNSRPECTGASQQGPRNSRYHPSRKTLAPAVAFLLPTAARKDAAPVHMDFSPSFRSPPTPHSHAQAPSRALPDPLQTLPLALRLLRTIQKSIRRLLLRHRCKKQRFFIHHPHILLQQRIHLSICRLLTSQLRALKLFVKSLRIAFRHYHRLLSLFG